MARCGPDRGRRAPVQTVTRPAVRLRPADRITPEDTISETIPQILHDDDEGLIDDWRGLIARLADEITRTHYQDETRRWPGPFNRRVLEDILNTRAIPIAWGDVRGLAQAATADAMTLGAIVGACLALTWPQTPAGLDTWLDRVRALTRLAIDEAGVTPAWQGVRVSEQGGWGTTR